MKGIEKAIDNLDEYLRETATLRQSGAFALINMVRRELEKNERVSQEWIDRNKEPFHHFETKKVDYYVSADFLQNLLVPEQEVIERHGMSESEWAEVIDRYKWHLEQEGYVVIEKPTIPQFVADYTEEYKGWNDDEEFYDEDNASDLFNAMDFDNAGMSDKVQDYLVDNLETFARAWLDGYTVEKEQRYIVRLPSSMQDAFPIVALGRTDKGNLSVRKNRVGTNLTLHDKYLLTEQEIKDYDERFWPFAVKVEELEE